MGENNFYSIDRLVEFGLSVAVATQMANSMNQSLQSMQMPGAGNALQNGIPHQTASSDYPQVYYAVRDNIASGPYSLVELARLAGKGQICRETYIWKPGMPDWALAENIPEVLQLIALTPPPVPKAY